MSTRSVITTTSSNVLAANNAPLHGLVARKRRREKREQARKGIFNSGWKSNCINVTCLLAAFSICFAHFAHLQSDADYKIFDFNHLPITVQKDFLPWIVQNGHSIATVMFLLHISAIKLSKTRFTFPALLALFAWPALIFLHFEQNHHRDYLISRLAISIFTLLISTAIVFLPAKLKRNKRLNTFYSAFSVASTPTSQRSSQLNQSQCSCGSNGSSQGTRVADFENDAASIFSRRTTARPKDPFIGQNCFARHRNGHGSSQSEYNSANADMHNQWETMSLRSGKMMPYAQSVFSTASTSPSTFALSRSNGHSWREKRKHEATPMREVRQLIDDLLINSTDEDEGEENESTTDNESTTKPMEEPQRHNANKTNAFGMPKSKMLTPAAISPGRKRTPNKQGPFASLTYNPAVRKMTLPNNRPSSRLFDDTEDRFNTAYMFGGGSPCSSLSHHNMNASPFRHL